MSIAASQLIQQPEGKTLEFKRDLSSPRNLLKTLVAFANTAGGRLIVGIEDGTRQVVGIENPLGEEERLCSLVADSIQPRLVPSVEMVTVENRTLLVVEVFLSSLRPHWLKAEGRENGVYVRLGSTNRQADQELIAELHRSAEGIAFDEMPMPILSADDLDMAAARECFSDHRELSNKDLLTLKLLVQEQGHLVPTKGGVLLFGKTRQTHFPDAWVQCGRFIGTDRSRIFDHIDIHEHLPQAVDSIMLFLKKHAMRGADFSNFRRKDVWSIPLGILREAIINALVHADYSQRGGPVRIAFFDDRIEIENPGILLPGMTMEDMQNGVSKIRNHVIARVFRELALIEQWGSGVRRMIDQARELGLPEPEFIEIGMRLRVIVRLGKVVRSEHLGTVAKNAGAASRLESGLESGLESETSRNVLKALAETPLQRSEIAQALGHERISGAINRAVKELMEKECIEYTIPEKPISRSQKYRLTKKGRSVLKKMNTRLSKDAGAETTENSSR